MYGYVCRKEWRERRGGEESDNERVVRLWMGKYVEGQKGGFSSREGPILHQ